MDVSKSMALMVAAMGVANGCSSTDLPATISTNDASSHAGGSSAQGGSAGSARDAGTGGSAVRLNTGGAGGATAGTSVAVAPDGDAQEPQLGDASLADGSIVGSGLTADNVVGATNLVAWYRFRDQKDPGADSSKAATHGAFFGDGVVVGIDPQRGYVGAFNGAANEAFPPSVQVDMTLAMWLQTSTKGTGMEGSPWLEGSALLDGENGGPVNDYGWTLLGSHVAFGVGNPDVTFDSKTSVVDGKWHHLAVTRDSTTGAVILYLDGTNDGGGMGAVGKRDKVNAHLLTGSALVGRISDIRLYDRVLTPSEILKMTME